MKVNLYNREGYLDPTVYEALTNIERDKKKKNKAIKDKLPVRQKEPLVLMHSTKNSAVITKNFFR